MKRIMTCILLALILAGSSCTRIVYTAYGIRKPRALSDKEVLQYARRYGAAGGDMYLVDTAFGTWLAGGSLSKGTRKNLSQPLQYMLFDSNGRQVSYIVNCYLNPGFTGLRWNTDGAFETFPVKPLTPIDDTITWAFLQHLVPLKPLTPPSASNAYDYTCVMTWNRMMGKQSRRLIKEVKRNLATYAKDKRVRLVFVNNDNLMAQE